jgi:hypothetical protein
MFAAIAFLLVMTTIMGLMVSMTSLTTKRSTDIYFQEQAHLLAKSATEFALLAISGYDRNSVPDCINQINSTYDNTYDINTSIRYFGNGFPAGCDTINNSIVTPESQGTVIIDVYVTTQDNVGLTEPVRFHRRTIQKP